MRNNEKLFLLKRGIGKGLVEANGMVIWNEVMSMTGLSFLAPVKCKLINLCPAPGSGNVKNQNSNQHNDLF